MECSVCYREYRLSPTGDVAYPRVGACGHSICNSCCDQLHLLSSDPKCPYCNRGNSFELQTRNFLAEDCLILMENTDLIEKLLPQLKTLVNDLTERKKELENELNEEPKGFIAWCKWKMARVLKDKEELLGLHKKVDSLIDLTTAVIRPKLSVTALSNGILQLEARSLETLEPGQFIYGPSIEVADCQWKMSIIKTVIREEEYFGAGVQMTSKNNGKKYKAHGMFTINSQSQEADDYQVRLLGTFTAPGSLLAKTNLKPWKDIVNSNYYRNSRLLIQCKSWTVNLLE